MRLWLTHERQAALYHRKALGISRAGTGVLDLALINFALNIVTLLIFPVFLVTGWIVTRRQYEAQANQYRESIARLTAESAQQDAEHAAEIMRLIAAHKDIYEQQQLAYARMVVAKDDQIDRLQRYMDDWKSTALGSLTGLKDVSRNAVTVAETVVGKLGG